MARMIDRREFVGRALSAGAVMAAPGMVHTARQVSAAPVASTRSGRVRGVRKDGVIVFKGIPYAASAGGDGRFKPPQSVKPWQGVRDALLYGPQAMQNADPNWPKEWKPAIADEDCLYLNVWTPAVGDRRNRPVMFYSHGGGFATGNGGADVPPQDASHDGLALARDYDVVVVTHNHRLGLFGYLHLGDILGEEFAASGVAGMLDIAAALAWVRDNIAEFGGDPGRVMIWGESGGGAKTSALTAMPAAKGLFHRASIESGPTLRLRSRESANATAEAVLTALGLSKSQARDVLKVPADRLLQVQGNLPRRPSGTTSITSGLTESLGFSPMVDGHHIPANPYDPVATPLSASVPLLVGTNQEETLFQYRSNREVMALDADGLRKRLEPTLGAKTDHVLEVYRRTRPKATPAELYIAITTAQWMGRDAIRLAERKAALAAGPVYMYVFAYAAPPAEGVVKGAAHASEIPFKFNHVTGEPGAANVRAAKHMSAAWAGFARTGSPGYEGMPAWPAYTTGDRATMIIDAECRVARDPNRDERLVWEM
jgi:para-nitrobenzyl esterase